MSSMPPSCHSRSPRSVLVIDGDADARALLAWMLERRGHTVASTSSAGQGLELLQDKTFDAVLTDENLPGMSGSAMLREAFAEKLLTPERTMMCTAHPFVRPAEGVRLMLKPLDMTAVAQFVETRSAALPRELVELVLYVAGDSAPSARACANLRRMIAARRWPARLHVRDVAADPAIADAAGIARTPVLVRTRPTPRVKLVGDLRDEDAVAELFSRDPFAGRAPAR